MERSRSQKVVKVLGILSIIDAVLCLILAIGALLVIPFGGSISSALGMPYLMPGVGPMLGLAAGSLALSILAGSLTGSISAYRAGKLDAGLVLREGV